MMEHDGNPPTSAARDPRGYLAVRVQKAGHVMGGFALPALQARTHARRCARCVACKQIVARFDRDSQTGAVTLISYTTSLCPGSV
jgi:hypothetical protein